MTAEPYRTARLEDLPRIVEIYNATLPSRMVTADLEPVSVESRVPWFEQHTPDTRPLWVLERDKDVVAWLSFSSFYGRPAYARTAEISIYIHQRCQRQGLGAHLLSCAISYAPAIGVKRLLGFIFAHNTPSLALFARAGFERWAHLPGVAVLEGVERDLVIVGRAV
jgi:phosphinothricin acetyltransferase